MFLLNGQYRRVNTPRESTRQNVDEGQWRQREDRQVGLRGEQQRDDRDDHGQVGQRDRDHHDERLQLLQVRRGATHQLAGLHAVVVSDVQTKQMIEDALAQAGLYPTALTEGHPAPKRGEDARDHRGRHHQPGPEDERAIALDATVDSELGDLGNRHLADRPQQAHHHAKNQPPPLLHEDAPQQFPALAALLRVGPFHRFETTHHPASRTGSFTVPHPAGRLGS